MRAACHCKPCIRFDLPDPGSPRMPMPPYKASAAKHTRLPSASCPTSGPSVVCSMSGTLVFTVRFACEPASGQASPASAPAGSGIVDRWNAYALIRVRALSPPSMFFLSASDALRRRRNHQRWRGRWIKSSQGPHPTACKRRTIPAASRRLAIITGLSWPVSIVNGRHAIKTIRPAVRRPARGRDLCAANPGANPRSSEFAAMRARSAALRVSGAQATILHTPKPSPRSLDVSA